MIYFEHSLLQKDWNRGAIYFAFEDRKMNMRLYEIDQNAICHIFIFTPRFVTLITTEAVLPSDQKYWNMSLTDRVADEQL